MSHRQDRHFLIFVCLGHEIQVYRQIIVLSEIEESTSAVQTKMQQ